MASLWRSKEVKGRSKPDRKKGSFPLFFNGKNMFLAKSRSLAFVPRRGNKDCHEKKKGGFWSKLLRLPKGKKVEEGLVHSRTMRERVIIISTS
ncbi:hypothetical protein NC653_014032 [Populus alba x Populus x berolinensis]|uniref:Uncharacterized protein n=1 Tax=Populus alba x Populus x berolinensis TaxID=444605 RepID=A0AAD6W4A7_9ROSI|nr:hypothetical protein NC653_014032 [Populus alba x Populus x berolinensis]